MTASVQSRSTLGLIIGACMLSGIGIACWNLLPVMLGSAADQFGLNDQQLGFLGAALLAGWLTATVPAYFFMHRLDRKHVTVAGAVIAALGYAASVYATSVEGLYLTWAIAGFGMALVYCVSFQLIAELDDIERSFGLKLIFEVGAAAILLFIFPAYIVSNWGYHGNGWGVAAIYLGAILFLRWVTSKAPQHSQPASTDGEEVTEKASLDAWLCMAGLLVFVCGVTGLWAFLERIGVDAGISGQQIGFLMAVLKIVGGMAGVTMYFVSSRYGLIWPHIAGFLMIFFGIVLLNYTGTSIYMFAAGAWIWEFGFSLGVSYQFAAIARLDTTNRLLLLIPSCIGLGGMVGPAVAGMLKDGDSYFDLFVFTTVFPLISAVIFVVVLAKNQGLISDTDSAPELVPANSNQGMG